MGGHHLESLNGIWVIASRKQSIKIRQSGSRSTTQTFSCQRWDDEARTQGTMLILKFYGEAHDTHRTTSCSKRARIRKATYGFDIEMIPIPHPKDASEWSDWLASRFPLIATPKNVLFPVHLGGVSRHWRTCRQVKPFAGGQWITFTDTKQHTPVRFRMLGSELSHDLSGLN